MSPKTTIFPTPITALPEADIPIAGIQAFMSQGANNQIIFMQFDEDVELHEHSHAAQWGIVLEGRIDLAIDGVFRSYLKGDRFYIPEGVTHFGKIYAGYADMTFFDQANRYNPKNNGTSVTPKIEHIALWVRDLEAMKEFYCSCFGGAANGLYHNPSTGFKSYFISFDSAVRLELMQMPSIPDNSNDKEAQHIGLVHIAFSVGSKDNVDKLTEKLSSAGYIITSTPRTTGDGYYESCMFDPEGNRVEITV